MSCENHMKYIIKDGTKVLNENDRLNYVSGKSIGNLVRDNLKIGNLQIKNQIIHVGQEVNIPVFQGSQWDGVVGLGHCTHSNCSTSIEQDSIIDNIFTQDLLENPIFTYFIKNNQGSLQFGEFDDEIIKDKSLIKWANLFQASAELTWTFNETKMEKAIKIGNPCDKGCRLLIDTGSYLNYLPEDVYKYFMDDYEFNNGFCNQINMNYPHIIFVVQGQDQLIHLKISPDDYILKYGNSNNKKCVSSITPDNIEDNLITLGQIFLQTYLSIFDYKNQLIGFYPQLTQSWK